MGAASDRAEPVIEVRGLRTRFGDAIVHDGVDLTVREGEIFALARDSFRGGQRSFQVQALPFRLTPANLARHNDDPNMPFWRTLKEGADTFDLTRKPPKVDVCDRHYVFNADAGTATFSASGSCPAYTQPDWLTAALVKKQAVDDAAVKVQLAKLSAAAAAEADAKAVAEAKAAAAEARAAERAAQPSLVTRLIERVNGRAEPQEAVASAAPAEPVAVKVPTPKLSPAETDGSAKTASVATADGQVPAGAKKVKKKFLWWDDEADDTPSQ